MDLSKGIVVLPPYLFLFLFFAIFFLFLYFCGLNGSFYLSLICPLWDLLICPLWDIFLCQNPLLGNVLRSIPPCIHERNPVEIQIQIQKGEETPPEELIQK